MVAALSDALANLARMLEALPGFHRYVTVPVGAYMAVYWLMSGLYALLDVALARGGSLAKFKHQPHAIAKHQGQVDWSKAATSAAGALRNQLLVTIPFAAVIAPLWAWRGSPTSASELPTLSTFVWQFAVVLLVQEACFYYVHRLLHGARLYRRIHRHHHVWRAPVGCAAHDTHPLEHALANMVPFVAGPLLVGMHWAIVVLWFAGAAATVVSSHSGYRWPVIGSKSHDQHHQWLTLNFGVLGLLDWLHGTNARR